MGQSINLNDEDSIDYIQEYLKIAIGLVCFLVLYFESVLFLITNGSSEWIVRLSNSVEEDPLLVFSIFVIKVILYSVIYTISVVIMAKTVHIYRKRKSSKNQIKKEDSESYAVEIIKTYSHEKFSGMEQERIREIVDEYSDLFDIEMDEETAADVVNNILEQECESNRSKDINS